MSHTVKMLLWTWIVLIAQVHSVNLPEITDKEFVDECVREHNKARSTVSPAATNMEYMVWDKDLAVTAKLWAEKCIFVHSSKGDHNPKFSSTGENLWVGAPPSYFEVKRAIRKWVDEKQHYDYYSGGCTKVCGHYTQVVWAQSYRVGCAAQLCPGGIRETSFSSEAGVNFVCHYAPGGNIIGRKPYQSGSSCSGCKGPCVDKLCRSYGQETVSSDDFNYVPILVIRPLAFFLTFVAAYVARYFYPDVFCYE